jgi:hypothetical protein
LSQDLYIASVVSQALSLLNAPFHKFLNAIFLRPSPHNLINSNNNILLQLKEIFSSATPVIAKGTSAGWLSNEGEDIPKAAKRFRKQAGGVPFAITKPSGLSDSLKTCPYKRLQTKKLIPCGRINSIAKIYSHIINRWRFSLPLPPTPFYLTCNEAIYTIYQPF